MATVGLRSDFSYTRAALCQIAATRGCPAPTHAQVKARQSEVSALLKPNRQQKVQPEWLLAYVVSQLASDHSATP